MKISKLIVSIVLCFLVAFAGSATTMFSVLTWYAKLNKPFFNPPNWVFGPAWTILYFLMGVSLYLVWNKNLKNKKKEIKGIAIRVFIYQLILNFLWSWVFFGLHQPFLALITIIVLWVSIFTAIKYFYKISKMSAYLLIPYILWVSFASVLNLFIVILN